MGCRITSYGGVNEVGGKKILLDDNGTRILIDFGKGDVVSWCARFLEEYPNPRSANGIVDFIETGLIPDVEGIYRDGLLEMPGRKAAVPTFDAVLVSHPRRPGRLHFVPSPRHPPLQGEHLPHDPQVYR